MGVWGRPLLSRDQNRCIFAGKHRQAGGPGRCLFPRIDIGPDSVKNWSDLKVVLMVSAIGACRRFVLMFLG